MTRRRRAAGVVRRRDAAVERNARSALGGACLRASATTLKPRRAPQLHYHAKKPRFAACGISEHRLRLPWPLTNKHHLLFTLLHVPLDAKRRGADEVCLHVGATTFLRRRHLVSVDF